MSARSLRTPQHKTSARALVLALLPFVVAGCGGGNETAGADASPANSSGGSAGNDLTGTGASTSGGADSGGTNSGGVGAGGAETGGAESGGTTSDGGTSGESGGTSSGGGSGGEPDSGDPLCAGASTEQNKAIVEDALVRLFTLTDESAFEEYWADPYLQHNPVAESGVDAFWSFFGPQVQAGNSLYTMHRLIGQCDLVVTQGTYSGGGIVFDMLRVQDGKLVEHWDSEQVSAGPNASGHSAIDGPVPPTDPLPPGQTTRPGTAENRRTVIDFTENVLIDGETASAPDYMSESLVEHDAEGSDSRDSFLDYRADEGIGVTQIHHVVADGDFVFTITEGSIQGQAYGFYDLYYLEDGLITHHWGARRQVPATTASGLPIF